ncbi:unnamed protein product [Echinostoma caproni]|uniref:Reverse transcriptase domain-containing protein n=1 Tax=Echinostoma caproni TaxID=27848 RepID=A0A183ADR7_9TREM|nr:unnamed protein product [Echinostoma caproni]
MERQMAARFRQHLVSHGHLCHQHYGFQPGRPCISNLLMARECWTEDNTKGHETGIIFVDFNKTFDKMLRFQATVRFPRQTEILARWCVDIPMH